MTAILGATFLGFQAYEFTSFVHEGLTIKTNLFGSTFFTLTGFHGAHVTAGVLWLLTLLAIDIKRGLRTEGRAARRHLARCTGTSSTSSGSRSSRSSTSSSRPHGTRSSITHEPAHIDDHTRWARCTSIRPGSSTSGSRSSSRSSRSSRSGSTTSRRSSRRGCSSRRC